MTGTIYYKLRQNDKIIFCLHIKTFFHEINMNNVVLVNYFINIINCSINIKINLNKIIEIK